MTSVFHPPVARGELPDDDNIGAKPYVITDVPCEVITDRPRSGNLKPSRAVYPFDCMGVDDCFLAPGKSSKELKARLYSAIHARKKKHPNERYSFEETDNGDLYVWRDEA